MLGDSALADLVASGDERAFEVLYERHRAEIFRYCRALMRHPQDAEEAFQLTMLSAYRALSSGGRAFRVLRPWLFRIAHNECMDLLRARPRSEELTERVDPIAGEVHERAELREQIRELRADIASLPMRQRSALVLHEMSGLSHAAVGEALGTDAADARRLLHEARVSLAAFGLGRDLDCREVRSTIADGDRRALRARTLKAHLRACEGCAAFAAAQDERRRRLGAYLPVLPAIAAARILEDVLADPVARRATAGVLGAGGVAVASGGRGGGGGGGGGGAGAAGAAGGLGAIAVAGIVAAAAVAVGVVATVAVTVSGGGPFASPPSHTSADASAPAASSSTPPSTGTARTGTPAANGPGAGAKPAAAQPLSAAYASASTGAGTIPIAATDPGAAGTDPADPAPGPKAPKRAPADPDPAPAPDPAPDPAPATPAPADPVTPATPAPVTPAPVVVGGPAPVTPTSPIPEPGGQAPAEEAPPVEAPPVDPPPVDPPPVDPPPVDPPPVDPPPVGHPPGRPSAGRGPSARRGRSPGGPRRGRPPAGAGRPRDLPAGLVPDRRLDRARRPDHRPPVQPHRPRRAGSR